MELSFADRMAIVAAAGNFYQNSLPDELPLAKSINNLALRISTGKCNGLTFEQLVHIRCCLEEYIEDFPDDSLPQQSLLSRLPALPPFA